jgi:hypothetical protein
MLKLWLGLVVLLLVASPALAVGPVVGTNCVATWSPVTTHTDGSPTTNPISYNLYMASGTPSQPPATASISGIVPTTANPCVGLTPGQYTLWVTAVETFAGSTSESLKSAASPFVLSVPVAPSGVNIK